RHAPEGERGANRYGDMALAGARIALQPAERAERQVGVDEVARLLGLDLRQRHRAHARTWCLQLYLRLLRSSGHGATMKPNEPIPVEHRVAVRRHPGPRERGISLAPGAATG